MSEELEQLRAELADANALADDLIKDCEKYLKRIKELELRELTPEKCDRILKALGVGKQSAIYKRVSKVLEKLMLNLED